MALKQRLEHVELSPRQAALHRAAEIAWGYMTAWHSSAGVDVRGSWPSLRHALRPLGERWMAYCACFWANLRGWRGHVDVARAVLDEVRRLEQPDWPAWLPAYRLSNTIWVSHWAGESAGEISELPAMLARLRSEGNGAGRAAFAIHTHLAEECLLRGRFEEGAGRLLALAEQGRQQRRDAVRMMLAFRPLILALTELDRLGQAREVVVEAMPLVRWFGFGQVFAPVLALFAARGGRLDTAARLLAAGEARRSRAGGRLELIGRHAEQKVRGLLAAAHADDQLSAWFREGAALNDEEFDRLVIHEA